MARHADRAPRKNMTRQARLLEIEEHALAAWPAAEVEAFDGWQLRAMSGVSRRANSAWTGQATGARSTEARIAHVEAFYAARSLAPSFQVGAHSEPAELDAALAQRGYVVDAPVSVQVADVTTVAASQSTAELRVSIETRASDA